MREKDAAHRATAERLDEPILLERVRWVPLGLGHRPSSIRETAQIHCRSMLHLVRSSGPDTTLAMLMRYGS